MTPKARSKTETRRAFLRSAVLAQAVEQELAALEQRKGQLTNGWLEHASRAGMAAETLGFEHLTAALESITDEERASTEADLRAEQASQNGSG